MVVNRNPLLLSFLIAISAFTLFSISVEHPWVAFTGAAAQLAGGAVASWFYTVDATKAVINPRFRNPDSPSSHHLVIGVALLGWGQICAGIASITYIASGSPESWLLNPIFYGGRYIAAGGFYFIYRAIREEPRAILSFRPSFTFIMVALLFGLAMFLLGLRVGPHAPTAFEGAVYRGAATYPKCQSDEPIWVSSNGIFHDPDSPDRLKIRGPRRCFRTAQAAEREGFTRAQN